LTAHRENRQHVRHSGLAGATTAGGLPPERASAHSGCYEARVQVRPGHYGLAYDSSSRWVNYGAQVRAVLECNPPSVLEIGIGNGTVSAVLRSRGVSVTTLDIDPSLNPDIVGSVHELGRHVPPKSFDVVPCAEVLEHLPFQLLPQCAEQLARVAVGRVVIGLPCFPRPGWGVGLDLHIPKVGLRRLTAFVSPLPRWRKRDAEHYWEVDYRPYTLEAVRSCLEPALVVDEVRREPADVSHLVLVCRPRDTVCSAPSMGQR